MDWRQWVLVGWFTINAVAVVWTHGRTPPIKPQNLGITIPLIGLNFALMWMVLTIPHN